ncbi:hypothetical protein ACFQZC_37405 [Streptacidiphilus monticola]
MLEAFGVDPISEAVYLAMLQRPDAAVDELTGHLGLEEPEIRKALDELARLALLRPPGRTHRRCARSSPSWAWRPCSPGSRPNCWNASTRSSAGAPRWRWSSPRQRAAVPPARRTWRS